MKDRLLIAVTAAGIAAAAMVALPAVSLAQAAEPWPGITISISSSATISTKGMPPGSEIWAQWHSLPPGKAVAETTSAVKWAYVEMALAGAAVVTGAVAPMCNSVSAGGLQAVGPEERTMEAGDVEACNYAVLPRSRVENRGAQPYVFAGLAVGGPWKEGMEDDTDLYLKAGGIAKAAQVASSQFGEVEKEMLKAGAMTLIVRSITMSPGSRIAMTDYYPTLRMVENGQLTLSSVPKGSSATAPKALVALQMMEWAPGSAEEQIVLSNSGDQPVHFVEWTVAPAHVVKP